jgi:hypothetical protein
MENDIQRDRIRKGEGTRSLVKELIHFLYMIQLEIRWQRCYRFCHII